MSLVNYSIRRSLAHIFLTDEQINVLKDNVNNVQLNVNPINMECINYYDRYNLIDRSNIYTSKLKRYSDNDIKTVKTIYNAIREGKRYYLCIQMVMKSLIW